VVAVGLTVMLLVVDPLLQIYVLPPLAVRVVLPPRHILVSPLIVGVGIGFTVTVSFVEAWHPLASDTVTLYVVVAVGLTVILLVVEPLLQIYVLPPPAVSVVLSPRHMIVSPLIVGVGIGFTVMVSFVEAWQPLASDTVTLYVVVAVGLTVILLVVEALLQIYVLPPLAVRIVLSPRQIIVSPLIVGVGIGFTVTVSFAEA
jgi:hypothetical protein